MARPRQVTDEQIARTAYECFLEHGPAVSAAVIAERLGVSQAALFKRVGTKEDLLLLALCPGDEPTWEAQLTAGPVPERPVRAQLEELVQHLHDFLRRVVPSLVVLKASGVPLEKFFPKGQTPGPIAMRRALSGWLELGQEQGRVGPVDAYAVADCLLGALEARCFFEHLGGHRFTPESDEAYAARVVEAFWPGLAVPSEPPGRAVKSRSND